MCHIFSHRQKAYPIRGSGNPATGLPIVGLGAANFQEPDFLRTPPAHVHDSGGENRNTGAYRVLTVA